MARKSNLLSRGWNRACRMRSRPRVSTQFDELLKPFGGESQRPAFPPGPIPVHHSRQDRGAERSAEMAAPFAPVETGAADRPAAPSRAPPCRCRNPRRTPARRRQSEVLVARDEAPPARNSPASRPRALPRGGRSRPAPPAAPRLRAGPHPHRAGALGKTHQPFQHLRHVGAGQPEIAMPPLLFADQQIGVGELRQMAARGLDVTPAARASSLTVRARPSMSAVRILARAGSPSRAATEAMTGPSFILRSIAEPSTSINRLS